MGINVYWKNELDEVLGLVEDIGALSRLSSTFHRQTGSACLRFIDPAGDACFNQLQLPVLTSEIHGLLPAVSDARAHAHLQAVLRLLERAVGPHTYIWFVGD